MQLSYARFYYIALLFLLLYLFSCAAMPLTLKKENIEDNSIVNIYEQKD